MFTFLGLTVGVVTTETETKGKVKALQRDITYITGACLPASPACPHAGRPPARLPAWPWQLCTAGASGRYGVLGRGAVWCKVVW